MADLYKLVILVCLINLAVGIPISIKQSVDTGESFSSVYLGVDSNTQIDTTTASNGTVKNWNMIGGVTATDLTDDDKLKVEQSATALEDNKGYSGIRFTETVIGLLKNALFGSLIWAVQAIRGTETTQIGEVLIGVYSMIALFVTILYIALGMKIYTWIFSKDTK